MIIKSLIIKNFRSYYGENAFEFPQGLTLIIGDNGDGKTTFYDAIEWLLNTSTQQATDNRMSEMRRQQLEVGECDTVAVSMTFDHHGEKMIEKSFVVERQSDSRWVTRDFQFRGYETLGAERLAATGRGVVERCFDTYIRRFSMFKGESDLNVLKETEALRTLVEKLSGVGDFAPFVEMTQEFENKSNAAYIRECRNDRRTQQQAAELEQQQNQIQARVADLRRDIREREATAADLASKIKMLEQHREASERYQALKSRVEGLEKEVRRWRDNLVKEDFNINLLDKMWVLAPFLPILTEFRDKVAAFSREKRRLEKEFIEEQAKERGRQEILDEVSAQLAGGASPLPWDLPDQATMQEMVDEQICKVCGRPAPKGSEAYHFMVEKLRQFSVRMEQESQKQKLRQAEQSQKRELFVGSHTEKLRDLSISLGGSRQQEVARLRGEITDKFDVMSRYADELKKAEQKLQQAKDDKARLLGETPGISEEQLNADFYTIKGHFEGREKAETALATLRKELEEALADREDVEEQLRQLSPVTTMANAYKEIHIILAEIAGAFQRAKANNLTEFLREIEDTANRYLSLLNTEDFHGIVRLKPTADNKVEILLKGVNGRIIADPSGSQLTTVYMSVLFAISDLTADRKEENYPLLFDAPTSSFGGKKVLDFYNIISTLKKQCIIVTKDFLDEHGRLDMAQIDQLSCTVYRLRKQREGFRQEDLSTVRTEVIPVRQSLTNQ